VSSTLDRLDAAGIGSFRRRSPLGTRIAIAAILVGLAVPALPQGASATFPGRNGRIAFVNTHFKIHAMTPQGENERALTQGPGYDENPSFSADGRRIAFVHCRRRACDIYKMRANGSGQTRLTSTPELEYDPAFSPNGRKIVFSRFNPAGTAGYGDHIYVMRANGSHIRRLTDGPSASYPEFSPDGRLIVFSREGRIALMRADGTHERLVDYPLKGHDGAIAPDFSPNGRQIVFSAGGAKDIYAMRRNGTHFRRLTRDGEDNLSPVFSPDGKKIAFESGRNREPGAAQIYAMQTDGTHVTRLTDPRGDRYANDQDPSWAVHR
jgi:TolB protein